VADSSGSDLQHYTYSSYGQILSIAGNAVSTSRTFTGREYDSETGLYFYRARTYDPRLGRFLQKDPTGFKGGDINLYRYVSNNPITLVDPSGKSGIYFSFGSNTTQGPLTAQWSGTVAAGTELDGYALGARLEQGTPMLRQDFRSVCSAGPPVISPVMFLALTALQPALGQLTRSVAAFPSQSIRMAIGP